MCIEFGPVRVDSVRRGGGPPPPGSNPPCDPLRRFTPSWTSTRVTCDCLLPFVHPLLSQVQTGIDQLVRKFEQYHRFELADALLIDSGNL